MSFKLFRKRLSRCVDRPISKKILGAFFCAVAIGGFIAAVLVNDNARDHYCKQHDCNDRSEDEAADKVSFSAGLIVFASSIGFVCLVTCCIISCHVDGKDLDDEGAANDRDPLALDSGSRF